MEKFNYSFATARTPINSKEIEMANYIADLIDRFKEIGDIEVKIEQDLIAVDAIHEHEMELINNEDLERQKEVSSSAASSSLQDPDFEMQEIEQENNCNDNADNDIPLIYKENAVQFWRRGKRKRITFNVVKNRFRKLTSPRQLRRWTKQIEQRGSERDKMSDIKKVTYNKFMQTKEQKMIVHDIDIQRWVLYKK